MRSLYFFIIKPVQDRYENKKKINNTELILNTEMQNHEYVEDITTLEVRKKIVETILTMKPFL
jgi:hypothetical protein